MPLPLLVRLGHERSDEFEQALDIDVIGPLLVPAAVLFVLKQLELHVGSERLL